MKGKKHVFKQKKKLPEFIAVIVMIFQFLSIIPIVPVNAADITKDINFITGVSLTDENGNPIDGSSNPIDKNSEVKLTYNFTISNEATVKKADTYTMQIPKEIEIISTLSFPINVDNGENIANVVINTDGLVTITFNEFAENNSNVSGYFFIDTKFDSKENVKVNNAQIIDEIRQGQEFIPGSVKINGKDAETANYSYDSSGRTLTYNFPSVIENTQTITFKTKVKDPELSKSEGDKVKEYNTVIFNHDGVTVNSNEAVVSITTDFIRKDGKYDPANKKINWTIYVNNNSINIPNAVVKDDIPVGLTFMPGSVKLDGVAATSDYTIDGQVFKYTFPNAINEKHTIEFSTAVTDELAYNSNDQKTYTNKVSLTGDGVPGNASDDKGVGVPTSIIRKEGVEYNPSTKEITWRVTINRNKILIKNAVVTDEILVGQEYVDGSAVIDKGIPGGVESTGTGKIKNTLVDNKSDYIKGNDYIDWKVTFNSNKLSLMDIILTDTLQDGLELDTTSVKLNKQVLKADGSLENGEEVALGKDNVKYDFSTREFTFSLPGKTDDAYILTFRTNVVDKKKSPFSNSIIGIVETSTSEKVDVVFQSVGGGGVGETGSIKVVKVNSSNENIKLQGAVFELLDKYQNVIKVSEPTGNNGEVLFDKLKFDIDYYVREKQAPTGYLLSNEVYKSQLKNSQDQKNIVYNYKNKAIMGQIEFSKVGENGQNLNGSEFTLYKEEDTEFNNPIATSVSDEKGKVEFKNVEYGKYIIKETKAPEGYVLSTEVLKAEIKEDGNIVKANPESISNAKIRGNIEFIKLGENEEALGGAEFTLYKEDYAEFENPIETSISDEAGVLPNTGDSISSNIIIILSVLTTLAGINLFLRKNKLS